MSNLYSPTLADDTQPPRSLLTIDPMGDFSLIPTFVVFGAALLALILGLRWLRTRARRGIAARTGRLLPEPGDTTAGRPGTVQLGSAPPEIPGGAPVRLPLDDLLKQADIQLVRMDDAIRDAADELEFARAEFGDASIHEFTDALATARGRASEAFALKQQLDDAYPDTEQQKRDWAKRILGLSDAALALVTAQSRAFERLRRLETSAPDALRRVRDTVEGGRRRMPLATATLTELSDAYDADALASVSGNDTAAARAFDEAEILAAEAEASLATSSIAPVTRAVQSAEAAARTGLALLDAIERHRTALLEARQARRAALDAAATQLTEAARLRDSIEDADAVARIADAAAALQQAVATSRERRHAHPMADVDALSAAAAQLDRTLAVARTAQQRLDSAREALVGAVAIATSHIGTARDVISGRRTRVGTDARTRLAAAERELDLARAESDPVAALDGARRAATLATDADALARYDALH